VRLERTILTTSPPNRAVPGFGRWVAKECPTGATVLNIGAGRNLSGELRPIRRKAACIVGVDPHESILRNDTLDERHLSSIEDFADANPARFDLAFSVFVLEHVQDPMAFTRACATVLKPGGVLMCMTTNKWQYFGLSTWAATRLGIADNLLARLRSADEIDGYHFPTQYRMNSIRTLSRQLQACGFRSADFRCWDLPGMYEPYLPTGVRWFARRYSRFAYWVGSPTLMGHITFKAVR
jgi:SAM-dependent methyltransferase